MAIDTAQKRASVVGYADIAFPQRVPAGAISTSAARGQVAQNYFGIAATTPSTSTATTKTERFWFFFRRRR